MFGHLRSLLSASFVSRGACRPHHGVCYLAYKPGYYEPPAPYRGEGGGLVRQGVHALVQIVVVVGAGSPVGVRCGHVQGVIDRLCAYLRSPLSTAADNGPAGESTGAHGLTAD
ncbi:hypothetical protein [Rothia aeria]|uniref:hypothetical protein n=1 Tax=Rothia aeria TaxID=172042 RepID=UPI00288B4EBE|nr:hypothetical protein [Rothia aeria]